MSIPYIDIENLSVTFRSGHRVVPAVKNASLRVERGEVYGLVGESGSGKSTLIRAFAGLVKEVTGGSLSLNGAVLGKDRSKDFYRDVQMVFQDPYGSLHPRHTVDATLNEPLLIHGLDDRAGQVRKALEDVGLDPSFRYRYPHQLSGGQRQRVAIARAIILEPKVLLLDEPTSALDVSVQAEILNLLRTLKEKMDLTMILVSHNLAVVSHMCDRMSVMRKGEVVEKLTVEQLRNEDVHTDYTTELLTAAKGYVRKESHL